MVAANKLVHLLEAFSTPWFLYSSPNNHHLVFFLLEVFNNIIQYQFDGTVLTASSLFDLLKKKLQATPTSFTLLSENVKSSINLLISPPIMRPSPRA